MSVNESLSKRSFHYCNLQSFSSNLGSSEAFLGINTQDDAHVPASPDALPPLPTGHSVLPPIGQTYTQLTPIGEASREHTVAFSLPVDKDGMVLFLTIITEFTIFYPRI